MFIISLFTEVKGLSNGQLQLISGGLFFIGIGEWKNWKVAAWIKPPNVYTGGLALMQVTVCKHNIIGVFFDKIGIFLLWLAFGQL